MYITIAGAGKLGRSLADWLISSGHEVCVVEQDRIKRDRVDADFGSISVLGDCVETESLSRAGVSRADIFVATTGDDAANLVSCQLAKHHFQVARVMSVVNDQRNGDLFGLLGIEINVNVSNLVLDSFQEGFSTREIRHLVTVTNTDGMAILSVKIPATVGTDRRNLGDMELPEDTFTALIITREGTISVPTEETKIKAGDEIIVVTPTAAEEAVRDALITPLLE